jgi:hypothetical protein
MTVDRCVIEGNSAEIAGGAIANYGFLLVEDSSIRNNGAEAFGGGAIVQTASSTTPNGLPYMIIRNSSLVGNVAEVHFSSHMFGGGGAIWVQHGQADIIDTTISGNAVTGSNGVGGAVFASSDAEIRLRHVTIADNEAPTGGGIGSNGGSIVIGNSIVASNTATGAVGAPLSDVAVALTGGTFNAFGQNLVGACPAMTTPDYTCAISGPYQLAPDPGLAALAVNTPGTTETHALLPGSPAIGLGSPASPNDADFTLCPRTDQRGVARAAGCDLGAYELTDNL